MTFSGLSGYSQLPFAFRFVSFTAVLRLLSLSAWRASRLGLQRLFSALWTGAWKIRLGLLSAAVGGGL